jgi:L-seryl-tRNA(Ser) seleniumtransferase
MSSSEPQPTENLHRLLPSVDALLQLLPDELAHWGHPAVTDCLRDILAGLRNGISAGTSPSLEPAAICLTLRQRLEAGEVSSLKPVINLTGTVLHTNLGRANLPQEALDAVAVAASQATNLEFDLPGGVRGDRDSHIEALVCELTGAEAATAVNNNAAAVLLVLNTLALNRQVPVSRGELVEIGGSFRIPEVMQRAGCQLVEVGSTNRTHPDDFLQAINDNTALLMKAHTSNYRVEGFTAAVAERELAELAHAHDLPLVVDLGSGSLVDFGKLGLPAEPTVAEVLSSGADLVTFSGDKLLGGPQCGIIAGRRDLVDSLKRNPLKRALRLDKMTLAAIAAVLKLYRNPETLVEKLPTLRLLSRSQEEIREQAQRLQAAVAAALPDCSVAACDCLSQIGSGALPVENIPSFGLRLTPRNSEDAHLRALASRLRCTPVPILGRLHKGSLWLDLRCLEDDNTLLAQLEMLAP